KGLFVPLLSKDAPAEVKSYTLDKYLSRLDYLDRYLQGREFVLDHFSVADAYLATVLNWSIATPMIDFAKYPAVKDYLERMKKRPGTAKARAEEFDLYKAEIARHKPAAKTSPHTSLPPRPGEARAETTVQIRKDSPPTPTHRPAAGRARANGSGDPSR